MPNIFENLISNTVFAPNRSQQRIDLDKKRFEQEQTVFDLQQKKANLELQLTEKKLEEQQDREVSKLFSDYRQKTKDMDPNDPNVLAYQQYLGTQLMKFPKMRQAFEGLQRAGIGGRFGPPSPQEKDMLFGFAQPSISPELIGTTPVETSQGLGYGFIDPNTNTPFIQQTGAKPPAESPDYLSRNSLVPNAKTGKYEALQVGKTGELTNVPTGIEAPPSEIYGNVAEGFAGKPPAEFVNSINELQFLSDQMSELFNMMDDPDIEKSVGMIQGRVAGMAERLGIQPDTTFGGILKAAGDITGLQLTQPNAKQIMFRGIIKDLADIVLRNRSGARINNFEMVRLLQFIPNENLPEETLKARISGFKKTLDSLLETKKAGGRDVGFRTPFDTDSEEYKAMNQLLEILPTADLETHKKAMSLLNQNVSPVKVLKEISGKKTEVATEPSTPEPIGENMTVLMPDGRTAQMPYTSIDKLLGNNQYNGAFIKMVDPKTGQTADVPIENVKKALGLGIQIAR